MRTDSPWYELHQSLVTDFSGASRPGVRRCEKCGELLSKWTESLEGLRLKKRGYAVSCTYDGVAVVSRRFRSVYDFHSLTGLEFTVLPSDPGFFSIWPSNVVHFDADRRKTRFQNHCNECGRTRDVAGATPVFLKDGEIVPDRGFARTDLEFGGGDEKHPLLLCGLTAGRILEASKLRGLDLVPGDK